MLTLALIFSLGCSGSEEATSKPGTTTTEDEKR